MKDIVEIPFGATSYVARKGAVTFCVGATGLLIEVKTNSDQDEKIRAAGLLGEWGREGCDL